MYQQWYLDLVQKYPHLLEHVKYPDVGDGWESLLVNLCDAINHHCSYHKDVKPVQVYQIKEKFGGLRFYYVGGDEYVRGLVAFAELTSYGTCESCGNRGSANKSGWIRVLCESCRETN